MVAVARGACGYVHLVPGGAPHAQYPPHQILIFSLHFSDFELLLAEVVGAEVFEALGVGCRLINLAFHAEEIAEVVLVLIMIAVKITLAFFINLLTQIIVGNSWGLICSFE